MRKSTLCNETASRVFVQQEYFAGNDHRREDERTLGISADISGGRGDDTSCASYVEALWVLKSCVQLLSRTISCASCLSVQQMRLQYTDQNRGKGFLSTPNRLAHQARVMGSRPISELEILPRNSRVLCSFDVCVKLSHRIDVIRVKALGKRMG